VPVPQKIGRTSAKVPVPHESGWKQQLRKIGGLTRSLEQGKVCFLVEGTVLLFTSWGLRLFESALRRKIQQVSVLEFE
jgi:hypothetical protein